LPVILAPAFLLDLYVNQSIILGQSLLLENTFDPDGDPLEITFLRASSGTLIETNNEEWSFTPISYDLSTVTLTYRISDDEGSVLQTATLNYHPFEGKELSGTEGHDNLFGTPGPDVIVGYGGNDLIISREDGDVIKAGDGNDRIVGGQGNDVIYAEAGDDVVFAGTGDDYVSGGAGDDFIEGEEGNDTLEGDDGDDDIFGGQGNDRIFGGSDDDNLSGGEGNDFISGDDGDDDISAGDGDDVITAGNGNDKSNGDKGDDTFIAFEQDGDDEYKGGEGADTVDYSSVRQNKETEPNTNASGETNTAPQMESTYSGKTFEGVKIDLINQETYSHSTGLDKLDSIENVKGSQLDDVIIADEAVNILTGNDGDDRFVFKTDNSGDRNTEDQSYKRDVIIDFEVGDKIDISELDGSHVEDGLQKLIFKYDQAEFDGSGQFIYGYEDKESGTSTILKFKFDREDDDDDDPDYEIELVGHYEMDDDHFYF
jgi:Ca2+-binding RTX toxin-like protein